MLCAGLALFILGALTPAGPCHAQGKFKPEIVLPPGYPGGFDGFGKIDRIAPDEVVIEDRLWPLAVHVEYNTPQERNTTPGLFVPGKLVGFLLDSQGRITSLWMLIKN